MSETTTRVIKKYQNRKLYDTKDSCYITLDEIAQLIKHGEDISVLDNKSKNDVTSVILTQILVDQEKTKKSALPISMLKNIIQSGNASLHEFISRYIVTRSDSKEDSLKEAERYLDYLVANNEISKSEAKAIMLQFTTDDSSSEQWDQQLSSKLQQTLQTLPNLSDIHQNITTLYKKLETLEERVNTLGK